jgi:hypothetical protein
MLNSELCQIGMTNHNMNLTNKEKKLLHTEITMIEYDENVVLWLGTGTQMWLSQNCYR